MKKKKIPARRKLATMDEETIEITIQQPVVPEPEPTEYSLGLLKPDQENARLHTPRNVGMLVDSLQEVGAARSIVIDENDVVLAGNATVEAAGQIGMEKVRVVDADGTEIIAVRRRGLTAEQKKRLALFDNRTAELATWNIDALKQFNDLELLKNMFSDGELFNLGLTNVASDPNAEWKGMPSFNQEDQLAWKQIIVSFRCAEDFQKFGELLGQSMTDKTKSIWFPENEIDRTADKLMVSDEP